MQWYDVYFSFMFVWSCVLISLCLRIEWMGVFLICFQIICVGFGGDIGF